ncbi:MAG: type II toxin-antitoxin system HicA family toxin [Terriglobia bacterium]
MSNWPSTKAKKVLRALLRIGWSIKQQRGSHVRLLHPERGEFTWAFHDDEEIGPRMLARVAKHTGLKPEDL